VRGAVNLPQRMHPLGWLDTRMVGCQKTIPINIVSPKKFYRHFGSPEAVNQVKLTS
jgi:hypothetical protein